MAERTMVLPDGRKIRGEEAELIKFAQENYSDQSDNNETKGLVRNIALGTTVGLAPRAEAFVRSGFQTSGEEYEKYKKRAFDSLENYAKKHPSKALAAQIGGALLPSVFTFGATTPATGASLATSIGRGALIGAGFGSVQGGMANRSDKIADRLASAGWGGLFGGIGGGVAPTIPYLGKNLVVNTRRFAQGFKQPLEEKQISEFILNNAIRPGIDSAKNARILAEAGQVGDEGIINAAMNLNNKMSVINDMRFPVLVDKTTGEKLLTPTWSSQTPATSTILKALETPALRDAKAAYKAFDLATPNNVSGAGLAIENLGRQEPAFARLMSKELTENAPDWVGVPFTSREGMKKMSETLSARIPKGALSPEQATKNRALLRGLEKLDALKEQLYPGSREIDQMYRVANVIQNKADETALNRIRQIGQLPFTPTPEISATGLSKFAIRPIVRGKARELVLNGQLATPASTGLRSMSSAEADAIMRSVLNLGTPEPDRD